MSADWSFLQNPESITGFSAITLEVIFQKYCGSNTPIRTRNNLAFLMDHLKNYTTYRSSAYYYRKNSYGSQCSQLKVFLNHLFIVVNELDSGWAQRNRPSNEVFSEGLGGIVTCSLDTFPIYIQRPGQNQELFYNGKYKRHILKVQVICDNTANIIWYSGPHIGKER